MISVIRSGILSLQPSGVWKQIYLCGPNRSRKVESKPKAIRKIIRLPRSFLPTPVVSFADTYFFSLFSSAKFGSVWWRQGHPGCHGWQGSVRGVGLGFSGVGYSWGWPGDGSLFPQLLPGLPPSRFLRSWLTLAVDCQCKMVSMAMYHFCWLPPQALPSFPFFCSPTSPALLFLKPVAMEKS